MVTIDLHRTVLITILRQVYSDPRLRTVLGFKGGTAGLLFYALPRFSIDLDFDLLDYEKKEAVFHQLKELLPRFGALTQAVEKQSTLFFLVNYQKGERNLKVEISKRPSKARFSVKQYLGISMLVMDQADMAAGKLAALLTRKRLAMRDVYDLWFFLSHQWPINEVHAEISAGISLVGALAKAQKRVQGIKKKDVLAGLGELLDAKQKVWVKKHLIEETLFSLKLYRSQIVKKA